MKTNTKTDTTPEPSKKKQRSYKVTNWREYNDALVARGSVIVWLSDDVLAAWNRPVHSGKSGHPKTSSDIAIQTALTMQAIYHLPLRATEGFVHSLLFLLGCGHLKSPDYSTLSYRMKDLAIPMSSRIR
ncbi:MAG TPA: transposase [Candidatus Saccharimonadia bacterium]